MTRVVFMGTPDFAVPSLTALIETQQFVGVVTQPDRPAGRGKKLTPPPVKMAALEANIPVFQPTSLRKYDSAEQIRQWQPDLIVVTAFGQILRPHVLDLPQYGCINVHASLLPRWRGAAPLQAAIMAGDAETGVTLMHMDVGLDTGDMYVVESVGVGKEETAVTLHDKLAALGGQMLKAHLNDIIAGKHPRVPQPEEGVTYASMIQKNDGELHWADTAINIDRRLRAMTPWPGAYTFWNDKRLKILTGHPIAKQHQGQCGQVIQLDETIAVVTGEHLFKLETIQLAGKRVAPVGEFVRGRPEFVGSILGTAT